MDPTATLQFPRQFGAGGRALTRLLETDSFVIRYLGMNGCSAGVSARSAVFLRRKHMLRKTLMTLTAIAVLGVGSAAMARGPGGGGGGGGHGGGGGGGFGGGGHIGFAGGGGWGAGQVGGWGGRASMRGTMGPMMMRASPMVTTPMVGRRSAMVATPMPGGRVAWGWHDHHFHDHFFHHRFHNRFFAFGFGVPYYDDYGYDSCWSRVWTHHGWRLLYVAVTTQVRI